MKFDVTVFSDNLNQAGDIARQVEAYGFSGLWTAEAAHNPFLPLTHAAYAARKIELGTAIAVAFPRSPMVTAQIAWDLAAQSEGRFILGLGTQVKAHVTKRFGAEWSAPVPRLREYIEALRAIWQSFQHNAPLNHRGEHYRVTLMTPFFNPGPIPVYPIPIFIAGVNEGLCRLAGEICQGLHVHPFHTLPYLRQLVIPAVQKGAEKAARPMEEVKLSCAIFVVTGRTEEERQRAAIEAKTQIAFYASTPSYRVVLEMSGWADLGDRLSRMAREGKWMEMWQEISDDMLEQIAVVASPEDLPHKVRERYEGILSRVGYYFPFRLEDEDRRIVWEYASKEFGT